MDADQLAFRFRRTLASLEFLRAEITIATYPANIDDLKEMIATERADLTRNILIAQDLGLIGEMKRLIDEAQGLYTIRATLHPLARPSEDVARFLNRVDPLHA